MSWMIYLSSVLGFWAATSMWFLEDGDHDADRWPILLIVIPLVSLVWPLLIVAFVVVKGVGRLISQGKTNE